MNKMCKFFRFNYMKVFNLTISCVFCILLPTEVFPKIFPNLNGVAHLVVPVGCDACQVRLAMFISRQPLLYMRASIYRIFR